MIISIIVAVSENNAIGKDGQVPWHLRADLKNFKRVTMGHHLIVGRKTFESIGRPLPGRNMVIVSRNKEYAAEGCQVVHSLEAALELAQAHDEQEVFVAGGAEIYALALPLATKFYFTRVHTEVEADTYFPEIDWGNWQRIDTKKFKSSEDNDFDFTISVFDGVLKKTEGFKPIN